MICLLYHLAHDTTTICKHIGYLIHISFFYNIYELYHTVQGSILLPCYVNELAKDVTLIISCIV